jgi:hypothetical protein
MSFESYMTDQGETPDIIDESIQGWTYLGWCLPGTTGTDEPRFKIKRIQASNGITKNYWANGNRKYDKNWDARDSYQYTFIL